MSDSLAKTAIISFRENKKDLVFGVYNGKLSISLFTGQGGAPIFGKNFNMFDGIGIVKAVKDMGSLQQGNQKSYTLKDYINNEYVVNGAIVFGKGEDGKFFIELQFKDKQQQSHTEKISLSASRMVNDSTAQYDPVRATSEGLDALIWWADNVLPISLAMSAGTAKPKNNY